jgi:hypothetical protein
MMMQRDAYTICFPLFFSLSLSLFYPLTAVCMTIIIRYFVDQSSNIQDVGNGMRHETRDDSNGRKIVLHESKREKKVFLVFMQNADMK